MLRSRRAPSAAPDCRDLSRSLPPLQGTTDCPPDHVPQRKREHPDPQPRSSQHPLKSVEERPRAQRTAQLSAISLQQAHTAEAGLAQEPARFHGNWDAGLLPAGSHPDDSAVIHDAPQAGRTDALPENEYDTLPLSRPARSQSPGAESPRTMPAPECRDAPVHLEPVQQCVMHGSAAVGPRSPWKHSDGCKRSGAVGEGTLAAHSVQNCGGTAMRPFADGREVVPGGCGQQHGTRSAARVHEVQLPRQEGCDEVWQPAQLCKRTRSEDEYTNKCPQQLAEAVGEKAEAGKAEVATGRAARLQSEHFEDAADGRVDAVRDVQADAWAQSAAGDGDGLMGGNCGTANGGEAAVVPNDEGDEDSLGILESMGTPPRNGGGEDHRALYLQLVHGVQVCHLPCTARPCCCMMPLVIEEGHIARLQALREITCCTLEHRTGLVFVMRAK